MNCDEFHDRLQRRLDDRVRPESDRELVRHTQQCERCRGQLDVWKQVSSLITPTPATIVRSRAAAPAAMRSTGWVMGGMAAAAVLLFVVVLDWEPFASSHSKPGEALTQNDSAVGQPNGNVSVMQPSASQVDPTGWWEQVQGRDWVGQTMPTVRSMREGVAPLGRTLMRAATMLTIGGRDQAS